MHVMSCLCLPGVLLLLLAAGGFWKAPKLFKWWASLAFAPAILVLTFIREVLRASGLWWSTAKAAPNAQQPSTAAAPQPVPAAGAPATTAGTEQTDPLVPQQHQQLQQQQQQEVIGQPAGRAAASLQEAAAAHSPGAAGTRSTSSSSSRSGSSRKRQKGKRLLPDGAWWPRSFGPVDLAVTCHWYTSLLGWHLARWCVCNVYAGPTVFRTARL